MRQCEFAFVRECDAALAVVVVHAAAARAVDRGEDRPLAVVAPGLQQFVSGIQIAKSKLFKVCFDLIFFADPEAKTPLTWGHEYNVQQ